MASTKKRGAIGREPQPSVESQFTLVLEDLRSQFKVFGEALAGLREHMDRRFEQIDQRFEQIDRRFEQVDRRFEQVDQRFEQVDRRFGSIERELSLLTDAVRTHTRELQRATTTLEDHDKRIRKLERAAE